MKEYREGDRSTALCDACHAKVKTRMERRDYRFADDEEPTPGVLVGACEGCGKTLTIPHQSIAEHRARQLSHRGYTGTAGYDAVDRVLHGRVDGIRDVILFEGPTLTAAAADFRAGVDDYLAQCEEEGRQPDRPDSLRGFTHAGFVGTVEVDSGSGFLSGEVLTVGDVISFGGATVEEAEGSFRAAVDGYLE